MAHRPGRNMSFSNGGWIMELDDGGLCFDTVEVTVLATATEPSVTVRLQLLDGRIVPTMLLVLPADDGTVKPLRVGALNLESVVEHAVDGAAKLAWLELHKAKLLEGKTLSAAEAAVQDAAIAGALRSYRRRGPAGPSDEQLRQVAAVYLADKSDAPTEAVYQHLREHSPVSHRTASRWVGLARERGFLPPYREEID